jgi:hypothetical protein
VLAPHPACHAHHLRHKRRRFASIGAGCGAQPDRMADTSVTSFVTSCSASRLTLKAGLEALGEYFEGAATLVKSVTLHAEQVVEILSFGKQLFKFAAKHI